MKYLLPALLFLFFYSVKGQDRLILYSGDTMKVSVVKVGDKDIKYRSPGNASGPVQSIPVSDVHRIHYANNTTLTFWAPPEKLLKIDSVICGPDPHTMFIRGMEDAGAHYKRNKGTFAGCFVSGFFGAGIVGIVAPIICAAHTIPDKALSAPDPRLLDNGDYYRGYLGEVKHKKLKAAWVGWALGTGLFTVTSVVGAIVYTHYAIKH